MCSGCPGLVVVVEIRQNYIYLLRLIQLVVSLSQMLTHSAAVTCSTDDQGGDKKIRVKWLLRYTPCAEEYISLETIQVRSSNGIIKTETKVYNIQSYKPIIYCPIGEHT